jgi:stage II sporulation protein AA (anti-sigma F factor antagonist)
MGMAIIKLNIVTQVGADNYEIVEFKGEMDKSNIAQIRSGLDSYLRNYKKDFLIFDLSALEFINSEGVGYLVSVYYTLLKQAKRLTIAGAQPQVVDVFDLVGLTKLIPCYKTSPEAVQGFQSP